MGEEMVTPTSRDPRTEPNLKEEAVSHSSCERGKICSQILTGSQVEGGICTCYLCLFFKFTMASSIVLNTQEGFKKYVWKCSRSHIGAVSAF